MTIQRLGLHDFWSEVVFAVSNSVQGLFSGTAILSGTITTNPPAASLLGYNPHGVFIRSSTTADGGYRFVTSSTSADYFGVQRHRFRCVANWLTAFTGRTVRIGYHDCTTVTDAVDGAYFEAVAGTVSCKTSSNSVRSTHATTFAMTLNVVYTFDIDVNAAGTSARFRIYAGTSETAVLDVTITTNIPNTTARVFGAGIVATEVSVTASDVLIIYRMGMGSYCPYDVLEETVFALTGTTPALNPFNGTIQTWTLTANSTPTDTLTTGQSITLLVDDGTAFTITWPTITWVGGVAPVLETTANTIITLFKVGSTLYGAF